MLRVVELPGLLVEAWRDDKSGLRPQAPRGDAGSAVVLGFQTY